MKLIIFVLLFLMISSSAGFRVGLRGIASTFLRRHSHLTASLSSADLGNRRLEVQRAKKEARDRSIQDRVDRTLQIKRLLHDDTSKNATLLYALKVSVCDELRSELKLTGREKRGRVFVQEDSQALESLRSFQSELHGFFRALRKSTYVLSAGYPEIAPDGTIESSPINTTDSSWWPIETDEDVKATFDRANSFYDSHPELKRPCLLLHVSRDPNAPPPPPPPAYLKDLADPAQSPSMTMLSFYAFPPGGIQDPEEFALMLRKTWKPFGVLGRVYVAEEGVNAQMSAPTNVLTKFMECCTEILGESMENGVNVDPLPLSNEEFATASETANGPAPPFTNLHIRVRQQIVADGLDRSYDWQSAGYDCPPLEWHERLKEAKAGKASPVILDCRNSYETNVGRFEGAEPLDTENFRESWDVLKERLKDVPKDAPIMTYCTGKFAT
jgi:hypothetical protein